MSSTKLENRLVLFDFFRVLIVFFLIADLTSGFIALFGFCYLHYWLHKKEILIKV